MNMPESGGYEFSVAENDILARTAFWVTWWAWIAIIGGILTAVSGIFTMPAGIGGLVGGGLALLLGMYFRDSARAMRAVVDTAGNDIGHLMIAVEKIGAAFKVYVILFIIGMVLFIGAMILALSVYTNLSAAQGVG
jgi:hypothetical protein